MSIMNLVFPQNKCVKWELFPHQVWFLKTISTIFFTVKFSCIVSLCILWKITLYVLSVAIYSSESLLKAIPQGKIFPVNTSSQIKSQLYLSYKQLHTEMVYLCINYLRFCVWYQWFIIAHIIEGVKLILYRKETYFSKIILAC